MANSKYIIIDGVEYKVPIIEMQRKGDVLDLVANRTEDGVLHREIIGTYYNYSLKFGYIANKELRNAFWSVLSAPTNHIVELPHDHVAFEAYFGSVQDQVMLILEDGFKAKGMTCNLVAVRPAIVASNPVQ